MGKFGQLCPPILGMPNSGFSAVLSYCVPFCYWYIIHYVSILYLLTNLLRIRQVGRFVIISLQWGLRNCLFPLGYIHNMTNDLHDINSISSQNMTTHHIAFLSWKRMGEGWMIFTVSWTKGWHKKGHSVLICRVKAPLAGNEWPEPNYLNPLW